VEQKFAFVLRLVLYCFWLKKIRGTTCKRFFQKSCLALQAVLFFEIRLPESTGFKWLSGKEFGNLKGLACRDSFCVFYYCGQKYRMRKRLICS